MTLTFEQVFAKAKKEIMRKGEHAPVLIVQTTAGDMHLLSLMVPLVKWNGGTTLEKGKGLFLLGRAFARDEALGAHDIARIFLVSELWFVRLPAGVDANLVPDAGNHPDRKEGISVFALSFRLNEATGKIDLRQETQVAEILRPAPGLIDLLPVADLKAEGEAVKSMLLPSFFSGICSAALSHDQLESAVRTFQETGHIGDLGDLKGRQ